MLTRSLACVLASSAVLTLVPAAAQAEAPPQFYSNRNLLTATHLPVLVWGELKLSSAAVGEIHCLNAINTSVWDEGAVGHGAYEGWGTNACKAPELEKALEEIFKKKVTVFATAELPLEKEIRQGEVCIEEKPLSECTNKEPVEIAWKVHRRPSSFPWKLQLVNKTVEAETKTYEQLGLPETGTTCYPKKKVKNEKGEEIEVAAGWEEVPAGCIKIDVIAPQIPDEVEFYGALEPPIVNGFTNGLHPSHLGFSLAAGLLVTSGSITSPGGEAPETYTNGEMKMLGSEGMQLITGH
jgi:hypothetical protein